MILKGYPHMPQGIYHIATAIYHFSGGKISRSRQGTYHWALRKSLFAMPLTADLYRSLVSVVTDAVQQLTILGHHNKQILLHKITSKAKCKEQKSLLKY